MIYHIEKVTREVYPHIVSINYASLFAEICSFYAWLLHDCSHDTSWSKILLMLSNKLFVSKN